MKIKDWFRFRRNKAARFGATTLSRYRSSLTTLDQLHADLMILAGVRTVAHSIAQLDWSSTDSVVDRFLKKPNLTNTSFEWFSELVYCMLTYGIAPQLAIRTQSTVSMVALDPARFKERIDAHGDISYEYGGQGRSRRTYSADEVCVFKDLHLPNGAIFSRVEAARSRIAALSLTDKAISNQLQNSISPSWIVRNEGYQLDEEARKSFLKTLKDELSNLGGVNSGGVLYLGKGLSAEQKKVTSPTDGDSHELRAAYIREVAAALGVPAFVIGGLGDMKFNNISAKLVSLYRDCLAPLITNIEQRASAFLGADVVADKWQLESGDFKGQSDIVATLVGRACLTPNEGRERLGLPLLDDPRADELGDVAIAPNVPDYQPDSGRQDGPNEE